MEEPAGSWAVEFYDLSRDFPVPAGGVDLGQLGDVHERARENGARDGTPIPEELRIWRAFVETTQALRSELASRLQSESSLSPGDYAVLLALREAGGWRLRPSELAARIDWQRSRLSHQIGRMERRGLIRREECAIDGRGAEVVLTAEGAEALRCARLPHLRAVRELFVHPLAPEQLAAADRIAATLRSRLQMLRDT